MKKKWKIDFIKPGSVLLSHVLRRSTIAVEDFRFPVRDGMERTDLTMITKLNNILFRVFREYFFISFTGEMRLAVVISSRLGY